MRTKFQPPEIVMSYYTHFKSGKNLTLFYVHTTWHFFLCKPILKLLRFPPGKHITLIQFLMPGGPVDRSFLVVFPDTQHRVSMVYHSTVIGTPRFTWWFIVKAHFFNFGPNARSFTTSWNVPTVHCKSTANFYRSSMNTAAFTLQSKNKRQRWKHYYTLQYNTNVI